MQHVFSLRGKREGKVSLEAKKESLQSMPSIFRNGLATANRMGNWQKECLKMFDFLEGEDRGTYVY